MLNSAKLRGIAQITLAAVIWGVAYPLTKNVLNFVPPITFGFLRFLIAAVILIALTRTAPLSNVAAADKGVMLQMAFWGAFVLVVFMNFGLAWAPGIVSSVISGLSPLFTILLAAALHMEPLEIRHVAACVLALAGLVMLCGDMRGVSSGTLKAVIGTILIVVPQVAWAIYSILGKKLSSAYSWQMVCRDTFALGALMLAPFAVVETAVCGLGRWNIETYLVLLFLGFFNSVVTYGLWNSALSLVPVSTAGFVLYLQPVSGVVLSMLMFGERVGLTGFLGIIIVFAALFLVFGKNEHVF